MAQRTLLQLVNSAQTELNLPVSSVVFTSTDQNVVKLKNLLIAVADDLLREYDWQDLITVYQFSTIAGQSSYSLPTDIDRFINGTFFDKTNRYPIRGPKTASEWEWIQSGLVTSATPFERFRIFDNTFYVYPPPGTTTLNFVYEYISNNYVLVGGTTPGPSFTSDSDTCVFDSRLIIYGLKLKWKASIGQDTTDALSEYLRILALRKGQDKPAPRLQLGPGMTFPIISGANIPDGNWS
jgi:hypothetical protein